MPIGSICEQPAKRQRATVSTEEVQLLSANANLLGPSFRPVICLCLGTCYGIKCTHSTIEMLLTRRNMPSFAKRRIRRCRVFCCFLRCVPFPTGRAPRVRTRPRPRTRRSLCSTHPLASKAAPHMPQLPDPERAVAQLHAAGDDIEALTEAIQAATFLKDTPGDARQKLRGARCCPWHAEATP